MFKEESDMKSRSIYVLTAVVILSQLVTACSGGNIADPDDEANTLQFEGILLHGSSILITKSDEDQLPQGQLISLSFPDEMEGPPAVGSLYSYEIEPALRESWPPQGTVIKADEIRAFAGHTVISFDTAEMILDHLPRNAYLIDVRTPEEYQDGHVSGAQNIPLDETEEVILTAVPEKADVIIVYCRSGNRSAQASKILEELGYQVILDAGGIIDYKSND